MRVFLTGSQLQAVSEFCVDVAKGLMLAGVLGQGITGAEFVISKIISSLVVVVTSLAFLYLGVSLRKRI